MNLEIVKVWNSFVKADDEVWHLGDFAFKTGLKKEATRNLFHNLNGVKHLLIGNHDNLKHIGDFGWASVQKTMDMEIHGVKFRMAHFPYKHAMPEKDKIERPECFTPDSEFKLIHGHVHESFATRKDCLNVGWDIFHRPISEDEVWKVFEATKGFTVDLDRAMDL